MYTHWPRLNTDNLIWMKKLVVYHNKYSNFLNVKCIFLYDCKYSQTCPCGHVCYAVTCINESPFFLSCHRNFHMNWTSFKRSSILENHSFLITEMTSKYRFDCIYSIELNCRMTQSSFFNPSPFPILITKLKEVCAAKGQGIYRILAL